MGFSRATSVISALVAAAALREIGVAALNAGALNARPTVPITAMARSIPLAWQQEGCMEGLLLSPQTAVTKLEPLKNAASWLLRAC